MVIYNEDSGASEIDWQQFDDNSTETLCLNWTYDFCPYDKKSSGFYERSYTNYYVLEVLNYIKRKR